MNGPEDQNQYRLDAEYQDMTADDWEEFEARNLYTCDCRSQTCHCHAHVNYAVCAGRLALDNKQRQVWLHGLRKDDIVAHVKSDATYRETGLVTSANDKRFIVTFLGHRTVDGTCSEYTACDGRCKIAPSYSIMPATEREKLLYKVRCYDYHAMSTECLARILELMEEAI